MKNDKRAWLKILESFIGVMILIGGMVIIINRQTEEPDIDSEIHDILRSVFNSLRDDDMMRLAVINEDECSVSHYIEKKIPSYLAFQPRICSTSQSCEFPTQKELEKLRQEGIDTSKMYAVAKPLGNIYADYTIISSSIYQPRNAIMSPKILKLFVWEGTPKVPTSCPAEAVCGNNIVENPEQCDGATLPAGASCQTQGYASGTLKCTSSCFIDKSGCEKEVILPGKCLWLETQYDIGAIIRFGSSIGECDEGEKTCTAISETSTDWTITKNEIKPTAESCNNKDDDCNNAIDNGIADITEWNNYYSSHACLPSDTRCQNCKKVTSCVSGVMTITDWDVKQESLGQGNCADLKDNDCDGYADSTIYDGC